MSKERNMKNKQKFLNDMEETIQGLISLVMNLDSYQEQFMLVTLDNQSRVIDSRVLYIGTSDEICVSPKEIFYEAVRDNARFIIVVHNHPSGDTTASNEDIATTKRIVEVGSAIGIEVLDYVIVTKEDYNSLRTNSDIWR